MLDIMFPRLSIFERSGLHCILDSQLIFKYALLYDLNETETEIAEM